MNMRNAICVETQTLKVLNRVTLQFIFYSVIKARFPPGEFVRATRSENKNPAT